MPSPPTSSPPAAGTDDDELAQFASNLRMFRARAGLTQKDLAASVGATERQIAHWERGNSDCGVRFASRLARALEITTDELLGLAADDRTTRDTITAIEQVFDKLGGRLRGVTINVQPRGIGQQFIAQQYVSGSYRHRTSLKRQADMDVATQAEAQ